MIFWLSMIVIIPFLLVVILLKIHNYFEWQWLESLLCRLDKLSNKRSGFRVPIIEILFIPLILFLLWGAFKYKRSTIVPFNNRIAVLADSTQWAAMEDIVRGAFERIVHTPQPEQLFYVVLPQDLDDRKARKYRYWILLSTLDSEGPVHDIVMNEVLPGNASDMILRDQQYAFLSGGPWGFDQLVMSLVAPDIERLGVFVKQEGDSLFAVIDDDAHLTLRRDMYMPARTIKPTKMLADSAGWTFSQLANMEIAKAGYDSGFVAFSAYTEGRWIFVRWIENGDPSWVNPQWMRRERDAITRMYYDSSYVCDSYFQPTYDKFLGRKALIVRGLWAEDNPSYGGPFTNYTFYDENDHRIYMIDVSVYAAGKDKMPYLQPLEVVAYTFVTGKEFFRPDLK
ncbi:DUF4837 family protein [bacterium]|nr:DUF4837 family protein [bacterium]